jgi:hypothetical protein
MSNGKKPQCEKAMTILKDISTSWAKMAEHERDLREHISPFASLETQNIINQIIENEKQKAKDISMLLNYLSVECYLEG